VFEVLVQKKTSLASELDLRRRASVPDVTILSVCLPLTALLAVDTVLLAA
jgi:hypothetical protein